MKSRHRRSRATRKQCTASPVFRGTRVPVPTLFEYLEGGETLEDFLEGFPTVSRSLAIEARKEAKQLLLDRAS